MSEQSRLNSANLLGERLGLSPDAIELMGKLFANSLEKNSIDGKKIFSRFAESGSMQQALGLSDEMLENFYAKAHQLFLIDQIDRAEDLFRILATLKADNFDYWLGYGICLRARGAYQHALNVFDICAKIQPDSPIPYFHRLELLVQQEEWMSAKTELLEYDKRAKHVDVPEAIEPALKSFRFALSLR